MKRREHSNIVSGNINWYSSYGEQYGGSLKKKKKTKNRATIYPEIPLLSIYPEKSMIQKDTCTPMFIAALLTTAKTWK